MARIVVTIRRVVHIHNVEASEGIGPMLAGGDAMLFQGEGGDGRRAGSPDVDRRRTSTQIRNLRYEHWRMLHDVGLPDALDRIVKLDISTIARLYGAERETVRDGIKAARRTREAIGHVRHRHAEATAC